MSGRSLFSRGKAQGVILLVLLIAIGGTIAAASYTETDKYCSSCHSMQPMAATWAESSHSEVGCAECHMEAGFKGWFNNRFAIARMRKVEKAGGATSFADFEVADEYCIRCHSGAKGSAGTEVISAPHTIHSAGLGITCNECHEGQVHGIGGAMPQGISHDKCISCHYDWFAEGTADCAKCHIKADIETTDKLRIPHEVHSFYSCDACHVEYVEGKEGEIGHDTCIGCHEDWFNAKSPSCGSCHINLEFTETDEYTIPHGAHIGFGCETCHGDKAVPAGQGLSHASCEGCHGDWFETDCVKCHKW
ncbi:MAG TPA: cytochrome c3 family protein [Bacillota bacterium]|nr:NapC/NirT family cytochrome c [Bacillota bacterium]HOA15199.1 cytochrome c3 family protein [Bacillota bacterium]